MRGSLWFVLAAVPVLATARPSFDLPDTLYAAPGLECNVYFASSFDSLHPSLEGGNQMDDAFAAWHLCELGNDRI